MRLHADILSLSIKFSISQSNGVGRGGGWWWMSVLTPVNKGVYAKQYESEDAEVQTTYT